jgi:hypothetical protein
MSLTDRLAVEVKVCPHGRGLFATEDIAAGIVIREFDDLALSSGLAPGSKGKYALRIGEHEYWDGFPEGSPDYWSNFIDHSDDPNAVFVIDRKHKSARLKAAKAIKRNQEIFIRYDSYHSLNPRF